MKIKDMVTTRVLSDHEINAIAYHTFVKLGRADRGKHRKYKVKIDKNVFESMLSELIWLRAHSS